MQLPMHDAGRTDKDIVHRTVVNQQRISDQRTMAAPRDCFRAHDRGCRLLIDRDQLGKCLSESFRLHVIGIAAKAGIAPAHVDGIVVGTT
jgi:hypothetical protein